ncbi:MAG: carbohydrate-binding family 9-like protein [Candidatus Omnitrophica bacterium]|nr:carbohydrate-binding family 9-like protein [Candidatus Omnitrophota bacterium]
MEKQKKIMVPKKETYACAFTSAPIKVDGFLDEPAWEKAQILNFIRPVTFREPISKTEGRLLYDKEYLYVGFKAYDQDIWSYHTERDSITCHEDVLEIFIKPDPVAHPDGPDPYYNFEINALGTVMDAFNVKRGAAGNYNRWSSWNCNSLKVAIQIKGTINDWRDKDEYWAMEVAIPFAGLPSLAGKNPRKGDNWLFHLSRYDYSVYLPEGREITSCAPLSKADFHFYEDWLKLRFE